MGLFDWYPFIRRKGYTPVQIYRSILASIITNGRRRLDVLGSCYDVIWSSCSNMSQDTAHRSLEKEVSRFETALDMTRYIDGDPAKEKSETAAERQKRREKALEQTATSLTTLESRIDNNKRLRKRHIVNVCSGLAFSYWSMESRRSFADYMTERHWTVKVVATEAGSAIAIDANSGDIIISRDSDMLAYGSIVTLWRPVSNDIILVYSIPDLLLALGITRVQLTALAVVSKYDNNRNIWSLSPTTNFSINKSIKSIGQKEFEESIRVFIDKRQTKLNKVDSTSNAQILYEQLRLYFKDLCTRHYELKRIRIQELHLRVTSDEFVRLRVPSSWNRYRTVESPRQISKASGTTSQHQPGISQEPTFTSLGQENHGHPALPRKRKRDSLKQKLVEFASLDQDDPATVTSTNDLIMAFKIRERQDARFRGLLEDDLPPRLTITVTGSDYYLSETCNIIQSKEDIAKL
ncbi:hypothetical protein BKA57DRAFT_489687 [Linnemannia elongata]|nr:hypothetical protein BKA57DRAFT_489687 [Linnemannia elongata]